MVVLWGLWPLGKREKYLDKQVMGKKVWVFEDQRSLCASTCRLLECLLRWCACWLGCYINAHLKN